jgi:quercetin dioxygenase-like cupin family protein
MNTKPFEIMRWESPDEPTPEFLNRMMRREGLQAETQELPPQSRSQEMKFSRTRVIISSRGKVQVSFPGYGVIEITPGDILEIAPDTIHDLIVEHSQPSTILQAFK